jgi:hypothetical protein
MKQKPKDNKDKKDMNELIDDPTGKFIEIRKMNQDMGVLNKIETDLANELKRIEQDLLNDTQHDPDILYKDTANCVIKYFSQILKAYQRIYELDANIREKLYIQFYNTSLLIYNYSHRLRQNNFSINACKYLAWIITCFESNIVLSGVKFLKWRVKLYVELASCYEDHSAYKSALKVVTQGIAKLTELKNVEELHAPLPQFMKTILGENVRIFKNLEMKFSLFVNKF